MPRKDVDMNIMESKKLICTAIFDFIMLIAFVCCVFTGIFVKVQDSFMYWMMMFGFINALYLGGQAVIDSIINVFTGRLGIALPVKATDGVGKTAENKK